jgi:hypothetical protein
MSINPSNNTLRIGFDFDEAQHCLTNLKCFHLPATANLLRQDEVMVDQGSEAVVCDFLLRSVICKWYQSMSHPLPD